MSETSAPLSVSSLSIFYTILAQVRLSVSVSVVEWPRVTFFLRADTATSRALISTKVMKINLIQVSKSKPEIRLNSTDMLLGLETRNMEIGKLTNKLLY